MKSESFCSYIDSYATTTLTLQKVHKEIIKLYELSGLVQIF